MWSYFDLLLLRDASISFTRVEDLFSTHVPPFRILSHVRSDTPVFLPTPLWTATLSQSFYEESFLYLRTSLCSFDVRYLRPSVSVDSFIYHYFIVGCYHR